MARVASTMLALGTVAPDFRLLEVGSSQISSGQISSGQISSGQISSGQVISRSDFAGQPLLVMFICRHCPFVIHVQAELAKLGQDYQHKPVGIVAISANDVEHYPDDAPERLREMVQELGLTFPLCYDETQAVAKAYTAACTPDFFLFDADHKLVYRGQLDDSRPGNDRPVTGADLRAALDAVLSGQPVPPDQKPSIGCNIKWKPGQAPDYFG